MLKGHTPGPWTDHFYVENNEHFGELEHVIRGSNGEYVIGMTWYDGIRLYLHQDDLDLIIAAVNEYRKNHEYS